MEQDYRQAALRQLLDLAAANGYVTFDDRKMKLEREKKNPPGFQRFVAPDGSSAHPAGFEPTACRLGAGTRRFPRSSFEASQRPGRLDF